MVITTDIRYKPAEKGDKSSLADITIVICSNKIDNLKHYFLPLLITLEKNYINIIVIFDAPVSMESTDFFRDIKSDYCRIIQEGKSRGLSLCRNQALDICTTPYLLFVDDDVTFTVSAVENVVVELHRNKMQAVGITLAPPPQCKRYPILFSSGQYHYLGWHNPNDYSRVPWGAFMGVDLDHCRRYGLQFNLKLGRICKGLQSGDDTLFIHQIQRTGGKVSFLVDTSVTHHTDATRLNVSYLLKRTFWQGRSEVMRGNISNGIKKEWKRYACAAEINIVTRFGLALFYLTIFCSGLLFQITSNEFNNIRS